MDSYVVYVEIGHLAGQLDPRFIAAVAWLFQKVQNQRFVRYKAKVQNLII